MTVFSFEIILYCIVLKHTTLLVN